MESKFFDTNKLHWDESATIHMKSQTGTYRTDDFRKGEDILLPIESREIGDLQGLDLIHLQCHFGLDTLSLARRGARVTGVDFSPVAIEGARNLSRETGVPGEFVECNLYDAPDHVSGKFDRAYVTWGAICWLPDLEEWARIVHHFLKPGGSLYLLEGHPAALALDEVDGNYVPTFSYFQGREPVAFDEDQTYTGDDDILQNKRSYFWIHPLSRIVNALLGQGMQLEFLNEHEEIPWKLFPSMVPAGEGMFRLPDGISPFPLGFSLKVKKPD